MSEGQDRDAITLFDEAVEKLLKAIVHAAEVHDAADALAFTSALEALARARRI